MLTMLVLERNHALPHSKLPIYLRSSSLILQIRPLPSEALLASLDERAHGAFLYASYVSFSYDLFASPRFHLAPVQLLPLRLLVHLVLHPQPYLQMPARVQLRSPFCSALSSTELEELPLVALPTASNSEAP